MLIIKQDCCYSLVTANHYEIKNVAVRITVTVWS